MSMMLMVKAMQLRVGNPLRKLVLIKLADNANDLGECWPSYQHIADQCEISRRSVINHIKALEDSGLLVKQYRNGTYKANSSNVYTLNLDGAAPAPSESPAPPPSAAPAPDGESPAPPPSAAPAPRTSHSFEPVNEPEREQGTATRFANETELVFDDRGRFAMNLDWQPDSKILHVMCRKSGVDTESITNDMLIAFRLWHSGKQTHETNHGWHTSLVRWAIRERTSEAQTASKQSQQPDFNSTEWAKDLGW